MVDNKKRLWHPVSGTCIEISWPVFLPSHSWASVRMFKWGGPELFCCIVPATHTVWTSRHRLVPSWARSAREPLRCLLWWSTYLFSISGWSPSLSFDAREALPYSSEAHVSGIVEGRWIRCHAAQGLILPIIPEMSLLIDIYLPAMPQVRWYALKLGWLLLRRWWSSGDCCVYQTDASDSDARQVTSCSHVTWYRLHYRRIRSSAGVC